MQWSQFTIFFGLLAVYFMNLRSFGYENMLPFWKNIISFLNLTATSLTLASLSVRFVFPQISLEGRRFWILGLAPISKKGLILQKLFLNTAAALAVCMPLIITSNYMLKVSTAMMCISVAVVGLMCVSLTSICIGLGTMFANLKEDNPAKIVSGFGGTLSLVISLLFIGVCVGALSMPFHLIVTGRISGTVFYRLLTASVATVVSLSLVTVIVFIKIGIRALNNMEF